MVRKLLSDPQLRINSDWRRLFQLASQGYAEWLADWDLVAEEAHRNLSGCMDRLDAQGGEGWALIQDDPHRSASFNLIVDGKEIAKILCGRKRADLFRLYGTEVGGFEFQIPAKFHDGHQHKLQLTSKAGRPYALICKGRLATEFYFVSDKSQKAADNQSVILCYDGIDNNCIGGWAMRRDSVAPVELHLVVDNTDIGTIVCNRPRPDVEKTGKPLNVGFRFLIPNSLRDGKPHYLAFRDEKGSLVPFADQGMIRTECEFSITPKLVHSSVDPSQSGALRGWVLREHPLTGEVTGGHTLVVTCDGERIGHAKADRYRPDVGAQYGEAYCGFEFVVPAILRKPYVREFRFMLVPDGIELEGSPYYTSFVDDEAAAQLIEFQEIVDRIYSDLTKVRRQLRSIMPVPQHNLGSYDSWARIYQSDLRRRHNRYRIPPRNQPLVSIICPTYRPDLTHFVAAMESVLGQTYQNWELIVVDDGSQLPELKAQIEAFRLRDKRVKPVYRQKNGGISTATNSAIRVAKGEWVAFFDHDDLLAEVAIEVMIRNAIDTKAKILYSDEDKIDESGYFLDPAFKPDWNYRYLLSINYLCHLLVVERDALREAGGFVSRYDGAQDHDLLLRLAEKVPHDRIYHVPEILYHWRISSRSTSTSTNAKDYTIGAGQAAIAQHLERMKRPATVESIYSRTMFRIKWKFEREPRVSIIVPFKDHVEQTRRCIECILSHTAYSAFDVMLVDNWSVTEEARAFCEAVQEDRRVQVLRIEEPFNYSRLNNLASARSRADFFLFQNNDVFQEQESWLRTLVNEALADENVAIVGAKLLYPDGSLQHAGVVVGPGGVACHPYTRQPRDTPGYLGRAWLTQELSAVTGACMLVRASVFRQIGGFDETNLQVAFNDVDLCLKVRKAGYKVVWSADVVAEHHESLSRGTDELPVAGARFANEVETMKARWGDTLRSDPHYSRHFLLDGRMFYDLADIALESAKERLAAD